MTAPLNAQLQPAYAYSYKAQLRRAYVRPVPACAGDTAVYHATDSVLATHSIDTTQVHHAVDDALVYHAHTNVLVYHSIDTVAVHPATPTITV